MKFFFGKKVSQKNQPNQELKNAIVKIGDQPNNLNYKAEINLALGIDFIYKIPENPAFCTRL